MTDRRDRYEVILAGSGGQGLVVSGIILAEAAMLEGKNVVQTQSYGIASRGGFSKAEVIIDREEIIFQNVEEPDLILALTEEAMEIFISMAGSGIPVFYDTTLLKTREGENLHGYPFTHLAGELGQVAVANSIALGVMALKTGVVKPENLERVLRKRFSGEARELNLRGLRLGVELVRKN